jgi:hypothetical protein
MVFSLIDNYTQHYDADWPNFDYDDPNIWNNLWNQHPLFIEEQKKQLYDITLLKNTVLDITIIEHIKQTSLNNPIFSFEAKIKQSFFP